MARPKTARYTLRRHDPATAHPVGLQWLISRNPQLGNRDGSPNLNRLSDATGMTKSALSLVINEKNEIGMYTMAGLTRAAMRTGVSRSTAERYLFELVEDEAVAA